MSLTQPEKDKLVDFCEDIQFGFSKEYFIEEITSRVNTLLDDRERRLIEKFELTPDEITEATTELWNGDYYPDYMFTLQHADTINKIVKKKFTSLIKQNE